MYNGTKKLDFRTYKVAHELHYYRDSKCLYYMWYFFSSFT